MKIPNRSQIRNWDKYTIDNEPIASIDLMERASLAFCDWFQRTFPDAREVHILCGTGNNGGDGLAIARLLHQRFITAKVYVFHLPGLPSPDFATNLERLPKWGDISVESLDAPPTLPQGTIVIDALLGTGLSRAVSDDLESIICSINQQDVMRVALDIPSGLFADAHTPSIRINAHHTFTFEVPKLAFFFPENSEAVGDWHFASIGLHKDFYRDLQVSNFFIDKKCFKKITSERKKFTHKGTYGHALLIMGSYGKAGAAVLAAKASLRSGVGLASIHAPKAIYAILQNSVPEAMVSIDTHEFALSEIPDLGVYNAIGIGCGLGTSEAAQKALGKLLHEAKLPLVLDADALNILALHPEWLRQLPKDSLLTPHPKEFERLFGKTKNDFERNELQRQKAAELGVFILLKGAHSCVATPEGLCYFNATGNPGMATAGSGDVLAGLLTGLLAQGFPPKTALLLGVYWHGLAGDLAAQKQGMVSMIASDIIEHLGPAFQALSK